MAENNQYSNMVKKFSFSHADAINAAQYVLDSYKSLSDAVKGSVKSIRNSIPMANNVDVVMGYEISLEIIRDSLESRGLDTSFMDEEGDEE